MNQSLPKNRNNNIIAHRTANESIPSGFIIRKHNTKLRFGQRINSKLKNHRHSNSHNNFIIINQQKGNNQSKRQVKPINISYTAQIQHHYNTYGKLSTPYSLRSTINIQINRQSIKFDKHPGKLFW